MEMFLLCKSEKYNKNITSILLFEVIDIKNVWQRKIWLDDLNLIIRQKSAR